MSVTPRPWRRSSKASDAIISDAPSGRDFHDEREYYGGYVVAESIHRDDLEFILAAVAFYDRMREQAIDLDKKDGL